MSGPRTAIIVTPAPRGSRAGNRVTALRWAQRLRELGWRVRLVEAWGGERCDLLVALHARKSHASIARHAGERPDEPRIVALTGTDLYGDLPAGDLAARESLALATRLVVLQPLAVGSLPAEVRPKVHPIRQSAAGPGPEHLDRRVLPGQTQVVVSGHLREVKDPLLAARAVGLLPEESSIRVLHLGGAPDPAWADRAREAERSTGGRWRWLGPLPRVQALRIVAGSHLLALTSVAEGGANVVTEAIACGVPVVSTRIEGSRGILGDDWPGWFEVGDAAGLAALLRRFERDLPFRSELRSRSAALRELVEPGRERASWAALLADLGLG